MEVLTTYSYLLKIVMIKGKDNLKNLSLTKTCNKVSHGCISIMILESDIEITKIILYKNKTKFRCACLCVCLCAMANRIYCTFETEKFCEVSPKCLMMQMRIRI